MSDESKAIEQAIEALARHRENGADPSPADLQRSEEAIAEAMVWLPIVLPALLRDLMPSPSPPANMLTQHQGRKIYKYALSEIVDEEPE